MEKYIARQDDLFRRQRWFDALQSCIIPSSEPDIAVDIFIGSTLQMDALANSSTVTAGRSSLAGSGGH